MGYAAKLGSSKTPTLGMTWIGEYRSSNTTDNQVYYATSVPNYSQLTLSNFALRYGYLTTTDYNSNIGANTDSCFVSYVQSSGTLTMKRMTYKGASTKGTRLIADIYAYYVN